MDDTNKLQGRWYISSGPSRCPQKYHLSIASASPVEQLDFHGKLLVTPTTLPITLRSSLLTSATQSTRRGQ